MKTDQVVNPRFWGDEDNFPPIKKCRSGIKSKIRVEEKRKIFLVSKLLEANFLGITKGKVVPRKFQIFVCFSSLGLKLVCFVNQLRTLIRGRPSNWVLRGVRKTLGVNSGSTAENKAAKLFSSSKTDRNRLRHSSSKRCPVAAAAAAERKEATLPLLRPSWPFLRQSAST